MILKTAKKLGLSVLVTPLLLSSVYASDSAPTFSDPISLLVGYAPGGASDRVARFLAEQLQEELGVNVIVENKAGAGGRIAAQYAKSQPENKDTLMVGNPAVMVVAPLVYDNLSYDPSNDFKPVSMVTDYNFGVAVEKNSPWQTIHELLEWAKHNPDEFNIAVPASGSLPYFFGLMLEKQAGVKAEMIGYRGSAPAIAGLLSGSVPVAIDTLDSLIPQYKGDRLRILATSGAEPEANLKEVPTFKAAGLPLQATGWNAVFAPVVMSDAKVTYLGETIKKIMSKPEIQQRFIQNDLPPVATNSTEATSMIEAFTKQWAPVIKESGYKAGE